MTEDGKIDMMDIMGMFGGGELDLTPPKSCGRIVTGFNGLIVGLETKSEGLEDNTVYEIESKGGILTLKKKGRSRINFNSERRDISQILLMERTKLILTQTEEYKMEVDEELADIGWIDTRDKYLEIVNGSSLCEVEELNVAEEKLKILRTICPMSKYPEKWI
jgi:hypothetical protein